MDTGGWLAGGDTLDAKVAAQAERALAEADLILMVVDVTTGVTEEDLAAAKVIRRSGAAVRLVVNKVDDANREAATWEFVSLGLGDPFPISALHGRGTGDLLDEVVALLPEDHPGAPAEGSDDGVDAGQQDRGDPGTHASPSSAGPTWGSRRSSTACSAKNAPSCTTCPAPRATPSTRWSRRPTGRCVSSTPPGSVARPKPIAVPSNTPHCGPCARWNEPTSPSW